MSGSELRQLVCSTPGQYTGTNYGAQAFTNDRQAMARLVFSQHPHPVSTAELMEVGRAQYQARRSEFNHDLKPFGLELRDVRKERSANGRWIHYYRICHLDDHSHLQARHSAARKELKPEATQAPPSMLFSVPTSRRAWRDPEEGGHA